MKGKRVLPRNFLLLIIGCGVISSLTGFIFAHFWHNPSSRAWFEIEFWKQWLRFGETLRLSHTEYHDVNKSGYLNLTESAIRGMVSSLDNNSIYYNSQQYSIFQDDSQRQYYGIGVMIRAIETGVLVTKVFPEGPAEKVGLKVGDLIVRVNQENVEGLELASISSRIKGGKGSFVKIEIKRKGVSHIFQVQRGQIKVSTVNNYFVDEDKIGFLHLMQFSPRSKDELANALKEMMSQGMEGLILDLRDNAGGLLSSAIDVASFFLPGDQLLVELRGRGEDKTRSFRTRAIKPKLEIPMIVLINESSASASEIVAGTLSVLGRAQTLGEKSYGKGSVQTVYPLSGSSGLRLTTAMYYLPDGSTIHEQGLLPDHLVACSDENESKLRIQRNLNKEDIDSLDFPDVFGFTPVKDTQLEEAKKILSLELNKSP